jgi:hypothetical protein
MPLSMTCCPHCGRPALYPNVDMAGLPEEKSALESRYKDAVGAAAARGAEQALSDFEQSMRGTAAVICKSSSDVLEMARSDSQVYATYYELMGATKLPDQQKWTVLRPVVDSALFPGYDQDKASYKEKIRFAALSRDGAGLSNYGECSITLRESMIGHRASVFEDNSVLFMGKHGVAMIDAHNLPKGFRAIWQDRDRLCVAKLHSKIAPDTTADKYQSILLRQGKKGNKEGDEFVEVHIWGPMTRRTFEQVIIRKRKAGPPARVRAIKESLETVGTRVIMV